MRSEITWPKRLPEALARVTAASYASSSRVTVVLIARYTDAVIHKCQHPVTHGPALQTETPKVVLINRGIRRVELSGQIIKPNLATGLCDFPLRGGSHSDFLTLARRCRLESVLQQTFPCFEARKPEETIK